MRTLILSIFTAALVAGAPAMVPYAIEGKFVPAPLDAQRIEGLLGERMRVNLEGRLLHIDEVGLLEGFQHKPGKQDWIGEHIGKYLDAGCKVWSYNHDERLKTQMDRMVRAFIATQGEDGYLGTYVDSKRWTSWDVWVHKYDLLGLLSYYETFGYKPALDASRKVGDLLIRTFGDEPGKRDIIKSSTHIGMAATSVLEPMVYLYRDTGDKRYLEFCRYILRAWEQPNGPKIVSSLNSTGSVFKTANSKAYEMMSDLVGLVEFARITGDAPLWKTAAIAWDDIRTRRLYITGTTSSKEHFTGDLDLPGEEQSAVGEGCATVTWLQLSWQLLRLSGEARYADEIEHTVYNQLLGAQDPANGNICYFTPLNGRKNATPGINCCVSSEPRGIAMIPQFSAGTREGGMALLLYAPGSVRTSVASIESSTTYPADGAVTLKITPGAKTRFPLFLRVPSWTDAFTATVAGQSFSGKPGAFLTIERAWKAGDTVSVNIGLNPRIVSGGPTYQQSVAILRGPQVLALEESLNPNLPSLDTAGPRSLDGLNLQNASGRLPVTWTTKQAYTVDGADGRTLLLVPFADARHYRVWLGKP